MIEVSVPSKASGDQIECYSLATTDFDSYKIPVPPKNYKGGINDDVLIYFLDLAEMEEYISFIGNERNPSNSMECRTQKLQRIIDSIGLIHPLETMKAKFNEKKFVELITGIPYKFIGTTLNINNSPFSEYEIREINKDLFLISQLSGEPLRIKVEAYGDVIQLVDKNGKTTARLQPE